MRTASPGAEQRVVLDHISWSTYLAILGDAENRRGRIAYEQGVLEIMSPSKVHEKIKRLIGRMIEAFTEELKIEIESASSTTFKREDLERGFEADECYYIQHAPAVRGKDEIDLAIDPPPDLIVDIDISRSSLNKFGIYRALRIPEVWRYDATKLCISVLLGGDYVEAERSAALPSFPIEKIADYLDRRTTVGETRLVREFRAWIQEHISRSA